MGFVVAKLASRAGLWYNGRVNFEPLQVLKHFRGVSQFYSGELTVDTLHPHANNDNPLRLCPSCNHVFPATVEYFHREKAGKDGLRSVCRECRNAKRRKFPVVANDVPEGYKMCVGSCGQILPATTDYFHILKRGTYGLNAKCKKCRNKPIDVEVGHKRCTKCKNVFIATDQYFCHHKEGKYGLNSVCKKCENDRVRAYDQEHPGEKGAYVKTYYQANKSKMAVYRKMHYQDNKEDYYASARNRRALKKNSIGTHTPQQIQDQYGRQQGKCYYCHSKVEWGMHHVDHVIPLTRGGSNDIGNLVIACQACNLSKNNKLPHEWLRGNRLL